MPKSKRKLTDGATDPAAQADDNARAPSFADLPDAFAAADEVTQALAMLCENLQRQAHADPQKRTVLVPVVLATGEYRDRLFLLLQRMEREGFFETDNNQ